jgi:hypothetical protein
MELTDTALRVLGLDLVARGKVEISSNGRFKMGYEWALASTDGMAFKRHVSLFVESEQPVPFVSLKDLIKELNKRFIFYGDIDVCALSGFDGVLVLVLHDSTVHDSQVTLSTFETKNVIDLDNENGGE